MGLPPVAQRSPALPPPPPLPSPVWAVSAPNIEAPGCVRSWTGLAAPIGFFRAPGPCGGTPPRGCSSACHPRTSVATYAFKPAPCSCHSSQKLGDRPKRGVSLPSFQGCFLWVPVGSWANLAICQNGGAQNNGSAFPSVSTKHPTQNEFRAPQKRSHPFRRWGGGGVRLSRRALPALLGLQVDHCIEVQQGRPDLLVSIPSGQGETHPMGLPLRKNYRRVTCGLFES